MTAQPHRRRLKKRALRTLSALLLATAGLVMILNGFRESLLYYYTPAKLQSLLQEDDDLPGQFRLGGLVVAGSVVTTAAFTYHFDVADDTARFRIIYRGAVPDLFAEGQGVVATGRLRDDGIFLAQSLLARHDENYVPVALEQLTLEQPTRTDPRTAADNITDVANRAGY